MLRQLDPDLLRTFLAIVADGSFRAAAERIGRTQSAVSMQIQRLEEVAGHQLFTRERPFARLTPKGEALLGYARRLLSLQDEALATLSGTATFGAVRLGMPDDYATGLLPPILARFTAEQPRIDLDLRCETSPRLMSLLDHGELDLAVITRTPGRAAGQFLRTEPLAWATAKRNPMLGKSPLPVAVFQPDCLARQFVTELLTKAGMPYRIAYSSPNLAPLLAVAEAGLAVAAMPLSSVPASLKVLRERDGFPPLPSLELALLRSASTASPAIDALADCIIEVAAEL